MSKTKKSRQQRRRHSLPPRRTLAHRLRRLIKANWPLLKVYMFFGLVVLALFTLTMIRPVMRAVVLPFNEFLAWSSAGMLTILGNHGVASAGAAVSSGGFGFTIAEGCNGIYALSIVLAGIVAIPMRFRHRLAGLALATLVVMLLNYVRILSLWYAGNSSSFLYEIMHTYLWEFIIIAVGSLFLYLWYERFVKAA